MALETSEDGDARTTHSAPAASGVVSRVLAPLALVIALIAAAGAGWALFGPARDTADTQATGSPTAAAPAGDPKANACDAFKVVSAAVSLQTHGDAGNDPAGIQAVAANARLAMAGGADYLRARTGPGTPKDLAEAIDSFADGLQAIAMNALAGVGNEDPAQAARLRDATTANDKIATLCK